MADNSDRIPHVGTVLTNDINEMEFTKKKKNEFDKKLIMTGRYITNGVTF